MPGFLNRLRSLFSGSRESAPQVDPEHDAAFARWEATWDAREQFFNRHIGSEVEANATIDELSEDCR